MLFRVNFRVNFGVVLLHTALNNSTVALALSTLNPLIYKGKSLQPLWLQASSIGGGGGVEPPSISRIPVGIKQLYTYRVNFRVNFHAKKLPSQPVTALRGVNLFIAFHIFKPVVNHLDLLFHNGHAPCKIIMLVHFLFKAAQCGSTSACRL